MSIRLKRRAPSERVQQRFRRRMAAAEAEAIVLDGDAVTLGTDVPVPEELPDRAADSWEVLLAIADAAGGSWPVTARLAAVALSSEEEMPVSVGMRLLANVRDAFREAEHLSTVELLKRLHEMDDAPWGDWYGSPLSARGLAKLLAPYRVAPIKRRVGGAQHRGYFASDFQDAWTRYVPSGSTEPVPSVPPVRAPAVGTDGTDETRPQAAELIDLWAEAHRILVDDESDPEAIDAAVGEVFPWREGFA